MAITPTKTWEYVPNLIEAPGGGQQDRNERLTLALKRALTDTGGVQALDAAGSNISMTTPWDVVASSDSVTADATDRWLDQGDIVGAAAGVAHSWIHLRQIDFYGSGDHLHLLIDCINLAVMEVARVSWTRGATGYNADGTTTNRPTHAEATDESITRAGVTIAGSAVTSDAMWGSDATNPQAVLHVRIADDGSAGTWFVTIGAAVVNWQGWQNEEEGEAGETHPFWVWAAGLDSNGELLTWPGLFNATAVLRSLDSGGFAMTALLSQGHVATVEAALSTLNAGTTRFLQSGAIVDQASTMIRGVLTDQWWGSDLEITGDGSPDPGPAVRRQVGDMVIPWPSGVAMTVT